MSNCWVNGKADVCVTRKYIELPGILEQPGALYVNFERPGAL